MKKLVAKRNGIELTEVQKAAVKRAFTGNIQMLANEDKEIELEYYRYNIGTLTEGIKVVLSEIVMGVKFENLVKYIGPKGGLK